jgi:hypothetical protein
MKFIYYKNTFCIKKAGSIPSILPAIEHVIDLIF